MKAQQQQIKYAQQTAQVLFWLQGMNKNKTNPREPLEEQLRCITSSYKDAQQKLLSLEKQVYFESLYNEKQRSMIEILKYIINGSMDDDTILSYLVEMQDQSMSEFDKKYEIRDQLQQIKAMVMRKKNESKKVEGLKSIAIADLKKQLIKCNQIKKQLMEDLDKTLNEKGLLEDTVQSIKNEEKKNKSNNSKLSDQIKSLSEQVQNLTVEKSNLNILINKTEQELSNLKQQFSKMKQVLTKINKSETQNCVQALLKVENKISKYRLVSKQLSQKLNKSNQNAELITALKLFLPQEAINICEEIQKTGQKFLIKQIEGIAKLQARKYSQLQNCQEEVWRLKSKLLRDGESWVKSRRTGVTPSVNQQNIDLNQITTQKCKDHNEVTEFGFND